MNRKSRTGAGRNLEQLALGVAAGLLAGAAMDLFAGAVSAATGGREADGAAPGPDRTGRGMQPPQAEGTSDEDAAVRVGAIAYRAVTGEEPSPPARPWLGTAAHYGFSITAGVCYTMLAARAPGMRSCFGTLYGTLVWAVADEGIVPALGLSRSPRQLSAGVHVYSMCGHWVYGAALEAVARAGGLNQPRRALFGERVVFCERVR